MIESQSFILFTFKTVGQKSDKKKLNSLTVYVFELEKRIKKCFQKEKEKELRVSGKRTF